MAMKEALLALLQHHSTAGQLQTAFDEATGGIWPMNIGQVTQTLARLERDGLITHTENVPAPNGREAKAYALTPEGTEAINAWWNTPFKRAVTDRDELVTKISIAVALGRSSQELIATFDRQRNATIAELGLLNRKSSTLSDADLPERLNIERRIYELEAEVRWLERAESLITSTLNS